MTFKELTKAIIEKPDCAVNCGVFFVRSTHEFVMKQTLIVESNPDPRNNCEYNKALVKLVYNELIFKRTFPAGTDFYKEFSNKLKILNIKRK